MLKKGVEWYLLEWKPINNIHVLMSARLKGKYISITSIQCYAPGIDSSDVNNDDSQCQSLAETENKSLHDLNFIRGMSIPKSGMTTSTMKEP
jgi:hypothetical protein